jgi:hypothetical protein
MNSMENETFDLAIVGAGELCNLIHAYFSNP